ncbi:Tat pathway signal sequence domain protein [Croceibacterium ferulae]|uniref:exo-rhamnogalacturonan lyase family protein n=1 Tax=Croceibacterium ferulae TaxID=1854641 RepID=UPI000EB41ABD|nr:Tat pathway signal sequence domain protein [Croceibacterium ferulae]
MPISRRRFVQSTALAGCAAFAISPATLWAQESRNRPQALRWLDGTPPPAQDGVTCGAAWPRGVLPARTSFAATGAGGGAVPMQSWVTARWPDGTVKWSGHAFPGGSGDPAALTIAPGRPAAPAEPVRAVERGDGIEITNGPVVWTVGRSGQAIIRSARRGDAEVLRDVGLTASSQTEAEADLGEGAPLTRFDGVIGSAEIEQTGPVRATVRVSGVHRGAGRDWLPFTLRLYFHAGSSAVRIVHSFVFDGDADRDFIRGLGLTGQVPMRGESHDRHVRFAGSDDGIWAEAVRPLTGLRRDPGAEFRQAQVAGQGTPPLDQMSDSVRGNLQFIPEWGDFTLSQPNADGFTIVKRTKSGHGWIDVDGGERARGLGYVGGPAGGVAFGQGDFWQRCPVRLDIRDAQTDTATFRLWYHAPDAPAMDLRFYHDGLGMDESYVEQNRGLDVTYEDYEPGWGSPTGIARTTEFTLWALPATPSSERLAQMAHNLATPARLMPEPAALQAAGLFGDWAPIDRSTPARAAIEDQNDFLLNFYRDQVEQRRWYGFWSYGDWMHTYDRDRHVWRYDIGGFAWANSELSPDLWLWYSYLRSGDAAIFRLAEAMTRHTGEVDCYHLGPWKGLGTRHGVQHWADSSKQPRVSTAAYRRIYYYLTADERTGDLLRECLAGDEALTRVDIGRKVGARPAGQEVGNGGTVQTNAGEGEVEMSFGTSWCSLAAAWLTEWERTGDTRWRDRIVAGMTSIAALPKGWFAGGANYDLATGRFTGPGDEVSMSHLNAVFGAVEVNSELLSLLDVPEYRRVWLDYCVAYNASDAEFEAMTGARRRGRNLGQGHSRLTAYAARQLGDPALAQRAWGEFYGADAGLRMDVAGSLRRLDGPTVLRPVDEAANVSTNAASQWGLAAIQNLALIGDQLPAAPPVAQPGR